MDKPNIDKFTEAQTESIGQIVVDYWGSNMQTGFNAKNLPYLAIKRSPTDPVRFWEIDPDGTVARVTGVAGL